MQYNTTYFLTELITEDNRSGLVDHGARDERWRVSIRCFAFDRTTVFATLVYLSAGLGWESGNSESTPRWCDCILGTVDTADVLQTVQRVIDSSHVDINNSCDIIRRRRALVCCTADILLSEKRVRWRGRRGRDQYFSTRKGTKKNNIVIHSLDVIDLAFTQPSHPIVFFLENSLSFSLFYIYYSLLSPSLSLRLLYVRFFVLRSVTNSLHLTFIVVYSVTPEDRLGVKQEHRLFEHSTKTIFLTLFWVRFASRLFSSKFKFDENFA